MVTTEVPLMLISMSGIAKLRSNQSVSPKVPNKANTSASKLRSRERAMRSFSNCGTP